MGALLGAACGDTRPTPAPVPKDPWFRERAAERGLRFRHVRATETRYRFPEIMGSGVALFDSEGDGDLDVYFVQSGDLDDPEAGGGNRFFENLGASFVDRTAAAGVGDRGYGMGCAAADYDADGRTDLFVTNVGPDVLYHNAGAGTFEDLTTTAGVGHPGWGTSSAFLDFDADGDLDLFVVHYLRWSPERERDCISEQGGRDYCSPISYDAPAPDTLYENRGPRFADVSEAAGLHRAFGNGLGVVAADLDLDGRVDVYVANDMMANQLWHNEGDGRFEDVALLAGCAANMDGAPEAGMGTVAVDLENDGDLDLFLTHLRDETNTFYRNASGTFRDATAALGLAGPSRRYTGFGVAFGDFDADGVLDLYVANGAVTRNRVPFLPADPYAEPDQLFRGRRSDAGQVAFEEVLPAGGTADPIVRTSRGAAAGDLDGDGDLDLVVVQSGAQAVFLENVAPQGHWLILNLVEPWGSASLGATARITTDSESRPQWRTVQAASSYCSSSDPRLHFGLGDDPGPARVLVRWPDGSQERFGPLSVDRVHRLARGSGEPGDGRWGE